MQSFCTKLLLKQGHAWDGTTFSDDANLGAPFRLDSCNKGVPSRTDSGSKPPVSTVEHFNIYTVRRVHVLEMRMNGTMELRLNGLEILIRHDTQTHGGLDGLGDHSRVSRAAICNLVHSKRRHAPQSNEAFCMRNPRSFLRESFQMRAIIRRDGTHVIVKVWECDAALIV